MEGKKGNTNSWHTPIAKKGNKNKNSPQGVSNKDGQNNKKSRSDNEESAGEKSNKNKSEKEKEQAGFTVDLESMSALMKKKSPKTKAAKQKKDKEKQEDSAKKTKQTSKKKAMFKLAKLEEAGEKKNEEEVAVCFKCVVGFAICIDKGNNAKGSFDKKISEGLTFLREYLDKAACILPSGKDWQLSPIKTKADLPKYQVIMKN